MCLDMCRQVSIFLYSCPKKAFRNESPNEKENMFKMFNNCAFPFVCCIFFSSGMLFNIAEY